MGQSVCFSHPASVLDGFVLPEDVQSILGELGVEVRFSLDKVVYKMNRPLHEDEMQRVWNLIADALPVIGEPKTSTDLAVADKFRQRQDEMFGPRPGG